MLIILTIKMLDFKISYHRHQLYIIHVILTHYMRANNTEHSQSIKNSKTSRIRIGQSSSGQSLKRLKQKNNKSNQKHHIQNNNKNFNAQHKQIEGRLQYFNQEKNQTVKKIICNKNDDYSNYGSLSKPSQSAFNKLRIQTSKGAIGFDGKIVAAESIVQSRRLPNQSRSIEQFTEIIQKSQASKAQCRKVKSKSHSKKSRNKSSKQKQKTKNKQNTVIKEITSKKIPYCFNYDSNILSKKLQTKGNTQTQVSFQCSNIQNLDIQKLKNEIEQNKNTIFQMNYLRKVSRNVRSDYLLFMSKFCYQMKLNKDVFFLAVELIDRYLNDQIMLNRHKILALATVLLCLKLDDSYMSKILNYQIFNPQKRKFDIQATQNTIKKQRKSKKDQKKKSEQEQLTYINHILKILDKNIKEEFKTDPTADQILQFQTLILIKQEFKIRKYDLSYWIDVVTLCWDRFIVKMLSMSSFSKKLLFRLVQMPQNYYFLVQIIEASLHSIQAYSYRLPQLVISAILLLCKVNLQQNEKIFDQIRINVQKSHNYLLKDKYGQIKLFLTFFQQIDVQMGDILPCCKFLSFYLNANLLEKVFAEDIIGLYNNGDNRLGFHRHYYNKKLPAFLAKG